MDGICKDFVENCSKRKKEQRKFCCSHRYTVTDHYTIGWNLLFPKGTKKRLQLEQEIEKMVELAYW
jgi:hypothetical protein